MKAASIIALPGAVLTCPECHTKIGVLVEALYQHFAPGTNAIRFERGQEPAQNQAGCRKCGGSYLEWDLTRHTQMLLIHTEFGWLPRPPPNVKPPKRTPIRSEALRR